LPPENAGTQSEKVHFALEARGPTMSSGRPNLLRDRRQENPTIRPNRKKHPPPENAGTQSEKVHFALAVGPKQSGFQRDFGGSRQPNVEALKNTKSMFFVSGAFSNIRI